MTTLAEIVAELEQAYPPDFAESWDRVGLVCGDPATGVRRVLVAVDATDAVVDEALEMRAELLLVHHPVLLKGVHSMAADTPKGRLLHRLVRGGCALYTAHTNADIARPGVNDALTDALGLPAGIPLRSHGNGTVDRWVVMVPGEAVDSVLDAVFAAGAGEMSGYTGTAFTVEGTGRFVPGAGTNPTIGAVGAPQQVAESRVEFVARPELRSAVRRALVDAHPYEVPAFDVLVSQSAPAPCTDSPGLGRVCELPESMSLAEFTRVVAERLPVTEGGVRAAGNPLTRVTRVAVCSGAGDSLLDEARRAGADVYLTGDLRHHVVDEHLRAGGPAVVDAAHWALEQPWCAQAAGLITGRFGIEARVSGVRTDVWTVWAAGDGAEH